MERIYLAPAFTACVLVDEKDYQRVVKFSWYVLVGRYTYYAIRNYSAEESRTAGLRHWTISMHRELLGLSRGDGYCVDHVDGCGWNNHRDNLRIGTRAENNRNQLMHRRGKLIGVRPKRLAEGNRHWEAYLKEAGNSIYIGTFETAGQAADARTAFINTRRNKDGRPMDGTR